MKYGFSLVLSSCFEEEFDCSSSACSSRGLATCFHPVGSLGPELLVIRQAFGLSKRPANGIVLHISFIAVMFYFPFLMWSEWNGTDCRFFIECHPIVRVGVDMVQVYCSTAKLLNRFCMDCLLDLSALESNARRLSLFVDSLGTEL